VSYFITGLLAEHYGGGDDSSWNLMEPTKTLT